MYNRFAPDARSLYSLWCYSRTTQGRSERFENNRAPLLCHVKLCAWFYNHQRINTGVTVRKYQIWVKISNFFSHMTLKFDRWPWQTIRHHIYAMPSFVKTNNPGVPCDFFAPCEFEIWRMNLNNTSPMPLQAVCIILLPDVNSNWSYGPETAKLGFYLCDLDLCPLILTSCMDITDVNGNNSCEFYDDMMKKT